MPAGAVQRLRKTSVMTNAVRHLVVLLPLLAGGAVDAGQPETNASQGRQFQQALDAMETRGDCRRAIPLFDAAARGPDRLLAAQSLLYLGTCFETLGRDGADEAYRRLVQLYSDQKEVVVEAERRLVRLGSNAAADVITTRRVWDAPASVMGAPSPDGRWLSHPDTSGQLAIRDLATGRSRVLTRGAEGGAGWSVFSPDGDQIAYVWDMGPSCELRVIAATGGAPRVLYRVDGGPCARPMDWSDDGTTVVALLPLGEGATAYRLALIEAGSGSVRPLHDFADARPPQSVRLSPDGKWVVFDGPGSGDGPERDIFILSAAGGSPARLVSHPAYDWAPFWTPDGGHVLFLSDRARGSMGAWMIPVADGAARGEPVLVRGDMGRAMLLPLALTRQGSLFYGVQAGAIDVHEARLGFGPDAPVAPRQSGENISPDWSADGRWLAYVARRGQVPNDWQTNVLVIHEVDTGRTRELTPPLGFFIKPRWAPDGRTLLVKGTLAGGAWGMHAVDITTGEIVGSHLTDRDFRDVLWTPDGRALIFDAGPSIWRADIATRTVTEIYRHVRGVFRVALSPDGSQVAFASGNLNGVWVVSSQGGTAREVLAAAANESIAVWDWTRDGLSLLVTRAPAVSHLGGASTRLWRVPLSGAPAVDTGLSGPGLREVRMHPDGVRVAYTVGDPTWEIWVMQNFLPARGSAR